MAWRDNGLMRDETYNRNMSGRMNQTNNVSLGHGYMVHIFKNSMVLPYNIPDLFQFFSDAANLEKITPPQLCFHIITPTPIPMGEGTIIDYKLQLYGIPFKWTARIRSWDPPFQFIDEQIRGPYRLWIHTHRFFDLDKATRVIDEVHYGLPLWPIGEALFPLIHYMLMRIFRFRRRAIRTIFLREQNIKDVLKTRQCGVL
jgi:ligand-binding SRPBCC domain-containing protein